MLPQALSFKLDVVEPAPDFRPDFGRAALGGEVEQVLGLRIEPSQLTRDLPVQQRLSAVLIGDGLTDCLPSIGDEVGAEPNLTEMASHVPLDVLGWYGPLAAVVVLFGGAEEVVVLAAPSKAAIEEQPALPAFVMAAATPQQALQKVVVCPLPFATGAPSDQDALNLVE